MLAEMLFSSDRILDARKHEDADAVGRERVFLDHVIRDTAPQHDPPGEIVPEVVLLDGVADGAGREIDASPLTRRSLFLITISLEFMTSTPASKFLTVPPVIESLVRPTTLMPNPLPEACWSRRSVAIQLERDPVSAHDEARADAVQIVIQLQVRENRRSTEAVSRPRGRSEEGRQGPE